MKPFSLPSHLTEVQQIGQGSSGVVYSAFDLHRKEKVAVKVIPLAVSAGEKELAAVRKYRQLHHPDMVPVLEFSIEDGFFFYTMPLADSTVAACGKLNSDECRRLGVAVLNGLEALHNAGFLHRDVKPENILICNDNYLLGDPGLLAPCTNASFAGTPGFIHPSVWNNTKQPDQAGDLYALGKVLYCALTGNAVDRYPEYSGDGSKSEAELMQLILDLCEHPEKYTINDLRKFLLHPEAFLAERKQKKQLKLMIAAVSLLFAVSGGIIFFLQRPEKKALPEKPPSIQPVKSVPPMKETATQEDEDIPLEVLKIVNFLNPEFVKQNEQIITFQKNLQKYSGKRMRYIKEYRKAKSNFSDEKQLKARYGNTKFYRFIMLEKQVPAPLSRYKYWRMMYQDYTLKINNLEQLSKLKLKKDYSYLITKESIEELKIKQKESLEKKEFYEQEVLKNYQQQMELLRN